MRKVYSSRASMTLYNVLRSNDIQGVVLMPSNICESVPATYMKCGMQVMFSDISRTDWQIDKDYVWGVLQNTDVSVLHYNHTYGFICEDDVYFLKEIKERYPQILIVDDRCLCFPENDVSGNPSDVILYSTGKVKCVDIGWGGVLLHPRKSQIRESRITLFQKG